MNRKNWAVRALVILIALNATVVGAHAAPVADCTVTGGNVILTEAPEGGPEVSTCMLPAGIAPPLLAAAFVLTENVSTPPLVISDVVVVDTTGLVSFFSDPSLPEIPPGAEFQTEAATNFFVANGTTYQVTSDVGGKEEVPEPATVGIAAAGLLLLGFVRNMRRAQ